MGPKMTKIKKFEKILKIYAQTLPLTKFHINTHSFERNIAFSIFAKFYTFCIIKVGEFSNFLTSLDKIAGKSQKIDLRV